MSSQKIKIFISISILSLLLIGFNNCAPVSEESGSSAEETAVNCNLLFKSVFLNTYYVFAQSNNCNGCHGNGIGPQFSIANQDLAFDNFYIQGDPSAPEGQTLNAKAQFRSNATVEPGHKGVGLNSHNPAMDSYEAEWSAAADTYQDCLLGN